MALRWFDRVFLHMGVWRAWLLGIATLPFHEGAHALAAILQGVAVEAIGFGVGGPLFSFTLGGVIFRIGIIPLIGYVDVGDAGEVNLIIAVAGMAANLILALILSACREGSVGHDFALINGVLLLLNLIPDPIGDGGKILTVLGIVTTWPAWSEWIVLVTFWVLCYAIHIRRRALKPVEEGF